MGEKIEAVFEWLLWNSRFVVLLAVIASMFVAFAVFFMTSVDAWHLVGHIFEYASPSLSSAARSEFHLEVVAHAVSIVDGYLLATILLIFSLGLYELFISKIDVAGESKGSRVLFIRSLDDLKDRLAKVILMILIVSFFERSLSMHVNNFLDLLYLALGIALVALALFLTHKGSHARAENEASGEGH
ncbi:YqhA family protein [Acidithiobacillus sp. IBUN Pt1247-S3]|uniref:YqhA family protein n=1 Tax=Acidithiobacillus sp. IBUN Pt1247-S3 TaxID=3166642 RepID=UPI0034E4F246